jgi:uncharacterized protein (DUF1501 family)
MNYSRRRFLKMGAHAAALLGCHAAMLRSASIRALAQSESDYRALVCVFLNGGNDGNNTIVPLDKAGYEHYAAARSGLALSQQLLIPIQTPTGEVYGLHPQLQPLARLFEQGQMAIVPNVGALVRPVTRQEYLARTATVPNNLYSHIDQHRFWQTASSGTHTAGWGGRAADRLASANLPAGFPVVTSVAGNAVFGVGAETRPVSIIPGVPTSLNAFDEPFEQLLALQSGNVLVHSANAIAGEGLRQSRMLDAALGGQPPLRLPFPATPIGDQLREVATVIRARAALGATRQIFFCEVEGFDTHAGQLTMQGRVLGQVGEALAAFYDATVALGVAQKVTTFTQSEFGRTLQPTSGSGSDHAWGSHHLVIGGSVLGGRLYGRFPTLALGGPDDAGTRGVWIPTSSVDQYAATLASWCGVGGADLSMLFPNLVNFPSANLGFLG